MTDSLVIDRLSHTYPPTRKRREPRTALHAIELAVQTGELFAVLGPNGSGKSTLFRILSTLLRPTAGTARILGADLLTQTARVRRSLGIVFQHPSLDVKLTLGENLLHQGHLYGLRGPRLEQRIGETLDLVGLADRSGELVEHLSGGMQRRVELAKCLLHRPPVLLLDEPSTGLDPGARKEFIGYLERLRSEDGVTVLLTTHILDEADRCDRIAIIDRGNLVALGSPLSLKSEIGGDVINVTATDAAGIAAQLTAEGDSPVQVLDDVIRLERPNAHAFIPQLVERFPGQISSVTLSKPTLEDVFIHRTGHRFWESSDGVRLD